MNVMTWADRHVERYGDYSDSVVTSAGAWSNGDVHDRSRRLAAALLDSGVEPGDRAVMWLPNGADLIVAFSAVVRAGAAAVLVGDSSPPDALRRVLAHSGASVLIASRVPSPLPDTPSLRLIVTTETDAPAQAGARRWSELIAGSEPLAVPVERSPDDIAQIVYTSGTTGTPKGVVWTHGIVRARYEAFADNRSPSLPPRRSLCALPLSAAFGAQYLYLRLLQKMSLHLLERFTPDGVLSAIDKSGIEAAMLVPSMCEALLAAPGREKYDLRSLRSVLVGGAAVQPSLVRRFREAFGARVTTVYGLTELGPVSRTTAGDSSGSVGRVRREMRIRIVDAERRELPAGEIGDVEIEADRLAAPYYHGPADEPAVADDGWFRTGDVGYLDAAGELWIVGRSKDIIIQGGVNVYPQLIVDAIGGLPGVLECAVVGVPHPYLGEEVVACVVRDSGTDLDAERVLAHCRSNVDAKHLPARVLFFPSLPRTDLGKVKIAELRAAVEVVKSATVETPLWRQVADTAGERRPAVLRGIVEARLRGILGRKGDALDPHRALGELGLDSIGAVQLANSLSAAFGRPISATLAFNHPTIDAVCRFLAGELFGEAGLEPALPAAPRRRGVVSTGREPVAIIGVGCRLPGNASSPDRLWAMLLDGVDATAEIDRWDLTAVYHPEPGVPGRTYTKSAALVADADRFDAEFFSMNRREAAALDPQHRMALEVSWHALEDAGYDPRRLSDRHVAVFLGISSSSYESGDPIGSLGAMAPARIAHFLDLHGTALAVDTTCSSSLIAIEMAVAQLRRGQCDFALAGGVNVICSPASFVGLSQMRALAQDGRCKAFDASADGFGRGEGCVIFVLKRLEDAQRDGDRMLAVIRGVASNHDGRSSSLTAPNGKAQEAVIREALHDAGIGPDDIDYLEAHGTGTRLGDPIEIEAAMRVFGARSAPIPVGSIKSNLGHLEAAAGAAGVLKAAMVVKTGVIPPNLHLRRLNPDLVPYSKGFWVPTSTHRVEPPQGRRRAAGVTSMGMSGTNVHLVLEQPPDDRASSTESAGGPYVLCVSARDDKALRELVQDYARKLAAEPGDSLADICYTAAVGRSHFSRRLAVCAATREEMLASLTAAEPRNAAGGQGGENGVAFLFSGDPVGDEAAMALRLYAAEPVYRSAVDRCAAQLMRRPEELLRAGATTAPAEGALTDAASFTAGYALAQLWKAWGVTPDVLVGQGVGAYTAECVAGVLDLDRALCLVTENRAAAAAGTIAIVPTVAGVLGGNDASGARSATADDASLAAACSAIPASARIFVEIGASTRLLDLVRQRLGRERGDVWSACRPDGSGSRAALLRVLAELYMAGIDPAWHALYGEAARRRVALPLYPFQRKRYWQGAYGKRAVPGRSRECEPRTVAPPLPAVDSTPRPGSGERVRAALAGLVARTLGRKEAPPDTANLVDAGVDSLRAMELLGDIARTFGVRLAPSDFNSAPTLAALAERVSAAASKAGPPPASTSGPRIVAVREGGTGTPLVCFHPAGGQVTAYMGLRGLVPGGCAILAFESRAVASNEPEFGTLQQMADAYAERLVSLGHGPVRLFGWSLGGVIAHAVAAVLEQRDVTVQGVGMVDPPEPGVALDVGERMLALTGIVYDYNPTAPAPARLMDLVAEAGCAERTARERLARCEARGLLPAGVLTAEQFERAWTLYLEHARLIAAFSPRPIRAPIRVWWASQRPQSRWSGSTSGAVRERLIGGSHYTIMRLPWVRSIAEDL